ncbi:hypothetical protein D9M71_789430 [compost metagenome]
MHESRQPDEQQERRINRSRRQYDDRKPATGVQTCNTCDEERRCGVSRETDALVDCRPGFEGAGHPADERAHHGDTANDGQVQQRTQLQCAVGAEPYRFVFRQAPADVSRTDEQARGGNQGQ